MNRRETKNYYMKSFFYRSTLLLLLSSQTKSLRTGTMSSIWKGSPSTWATDQGWIPRKSTRNRNAPPCPVQTMHCFIQNWDWSVPTEWRAVMSTFSQPQFRIDGIEYLTQYYVKFMSINSCYIINCYLNIGLIKHNFLSQSFLFVFDF